MFKVIKRFFRNRKINKAVTKWKVGQTIDMLIHNMSEGLVASLEKTGMSGDEIQKAVYDNKSYIRDAVNDGLSLIELCDQVKDRVLAKESSINELREVIIEEADDKAKESKSVVVDSIKNAGNKIKGVFKRDPKGAKPGIQDVILEPVK